MNIHCQSIKMNVFLHFIHQYSLFRTTAIHIQSVFTYYMSTYDVGGYGCWLNTHRRRTIFCRSMRCGGGVFPCLVVWSFALSCKALRYCIMFVNRNAKKGYKDDSKFYYNEPGNFSPLFFFSNFVAIENL